jgi:hypothetical protein
MYITMAGCGARSNSPAGATLVDPDGHKGPMKGDTPGNKGPMIGVLGEAAGAGGWVGSEGGGGG